MYRGRLSHGGIITDFRLDRLEHSSYTLVDSLEERFSFERGF